jgi:hypothetical protein
MLTQFMEALSDSCSLDIWVMQLMTMLEMGRETFRSAALKIRGPVNSRIYRMGGSGGHRRGCYCQSMAMGQEASALL